VLGVILPETLVTNTILRVLVLLEANLAGTILFEIFLVEIILLEAILVKINSLDIILLRDSLAEEAKNWRIRNWEESSGCECRRILRSSISMDAEGGGL
jgi:hypothetical protein